MSDGTERRCRDNALKVVMVRRRRFLPGYAGGKEIFEREFKKSVRTGWIWFSDVVHVAHTVILCGGGEGERRVKVDQCRRTDQHRYGEVIRDSNLNVELKAQKSPKKIYKKSN